MNETIDLSLYKEALLFLVTAGVVAPLFVRLRVSPVLGFLLAGMALGPYGLGRLAANARWLDALAITNTEAIDRIAAFGVVFLMFTMGLELSFERMRRMRRLVFGLGLAQVLATTLVLGAAAWALDFAPAAAAAIGAALAMSSTAIVIPLMAESKRLHSLAGRASVSVLLFQDLAVAPLLVMTGALARGEGGLGLELLSVLAPAALAVVALIVFGRLALRPFFHFVAQTRSPEFFMAACLLVVLGDGLVAAASHLSMALGAFVAGLLLAETEYRREIEVTIEPFRGLLLGLFFVSVGAGINLELITARPALLIGLAAALIAAKALALFALALGLRLPARVAAETALPLGGGGEFGFVMIGAAQASGLIDRPLAATLIAAIAISMLAIPLLARFAARIGTTPPTRAYEAPTETPPESEAPRVIVAGYGRVGALVGDMLDWHKIPFIAVDLDVKVTTRARADGRPVYYGDASRSEYLRRCGLESARAVVVTMDSPAANEQVVEAARRLRPDVTLIARARDAGHARTLYELGVTDAVPETVEASLQLAEAVLVDVGVPMGQVIASIHEKRDEFRKILAAAGAPERPRSARRPRRG